MKIQYDEDDDVLFIEFAKDEIIPYESMDGIVNIRYTAIGFGEITILEAKRCGICPLQIEQVIADAA